MARSSQWYEDNPLTKSHWWHKPSSWSNPPFGNLWRLWWQLQWLEIVDILCKSQQNEWTHVNEDVCISPAVLAAAWGPVTQTWPQPAIFRTVQCSSPACWLHCVSNTFHWWEFSCLLIKTRTFLSFLINTAVSHTTLCMCTGYSIQS